MRMWFVLVASVSAVSPAVTPPAAIEASLAPDQPIPHVYVDDPLILELRSGQDLSAAVTVEVSAHGQLTTIDLGRIGLRGGAIHWQAVPDIPVDRGRYQVRIRTEASGADPVEQSAWVASIWPLRVVTAVRMPISRAISNSPVPALAASRNGRYMRICYQSNPHVLFITSPSKVTKARLHCSTTLRGSRIRSLPK